VPRRVRKTVTVLFADLVGSTALGERMDAEVLDRIKARFFDASRAAIERRGGTVEKFVGDAVMAAFGIPQAHEDDPLRAVEAAEEIRGALAPLREELGVELEARIGIDTGEVLAGDPSAGQGFATGDVVNVAARLEQSAAPGEILIGPGTHARVSWATRCERVDPLELKGKSSPVQAWRLEAVRPDAEPIPRRFDAPLVGRDRELAALRAAFGEATAEPGLRLVTLVGEAGIGKSRLAEELVRQLRGEATVVAGRCPPYGEGITYWPLAEIIRDAAHHEARAAIVELFEGQEQSELVAARIAAVIGTSEVSTSGDEIAWAARKLFERLARDRPLVVRLEDVQWGAPTFLDLVEHVAYLSRGAPILLLCSARPELADARPGWPGTKVQLERLSLEDSDALAAWHLAGVEDGRGLVERVVERGEGNPLFVEQLAAVLAEGGSPDAVPATLEGLLTARLDRLDVGSRELLERASVIGLEFSGAGLRHLGSGGDVGPAVLDLIRQGLVEPHEGPVDDDEGLRFTHLLVRDATYAGIPKGERAALHERLAEWIESGAIRVPVDELAGYHLEQSYRYRVELGHHGDELTVLGERAGAHLLAAARRAEREFGDVRSATGLLRRALELIGDDSPAELDAKLTLAQLLFESGELGEAQQLADESAARATRDQDPEGEVAAVLLRERSTAARTGDFGNLRAAAREAIAVFQAAGNDLGLAGAWLLLGQDFDATGEPDAARRAAEQALEAARRAHDLTLEAGARSSLWRGLYQSPIPAVEVVRNAEEFAAWADATGNLGLERRSSFALARSYALVGRFDEARELLSRSRTLAEELGAGVGVAGCDWAAGEVALLAGDGPEAVRALTAALEFFERVDDKSYTATVAAELAHALIEVGDLDAALVQANLSRRTAAEDDLTAQVPWRTARARVLGRSGEFEEAERLLGEAYALEPSFRTREHMAEVVALAGRSNEARRLLTEALDYLVAKGNVPGTARVRALLAQLEAEPSAERD
jgi:class 3 adenylate cyclase/tetratricopeptide (TPR) repeat protein